ncbi:MAG: MarR family transcriptional regulator [Alphaproteobacteria bacterium]|nr:MarR family transcriptional regulator [Alphaproteobacteria bacterium]
MTLIRQQAKRAMTTRGQKACRVIDYMVEALANDPSCSLRRALLVNYIDESPGITQTELLKHFDITKSAMNREIEWLFNYGCVTRQSGTEDGREVKLETCGYTKRAIQDALDYFPEGHKGLHFFLERYINILDKSKPTLRDARIISTLYDKKKATKAEIMDNLYNGPATSDKRAYDKLVKDGVIKEDG